MSESSIFFVVIFISFIIFIAIVYLINFLGSPKISHNDILNVLVMDRWQDINKIRNILEISRYLPRGTISTRRLIKLIKELEDVGFVETVFKEPESEKMQLVNNLFGGCNTFFYRLTPIGNDHIKSINNQKAVI